MNIITLPRGRGKTTAIVSASALSGTPILCANKVKEKHIYEVAEKLGLKIPAPIIIGTQKGRAVQEVLIDDAEDILRILIKEAIGAKILGITMTGDDEKPPADFPAEPQYKRTNCLHAKEVNCTGFCKACRHEFVQL